MLTKLAVAASALVATNVHATDGPAVTHTSYMDIESGQPGTKDYFKIKFTFGLFGESTPKTAANFFLLCKGFTKQEKTGSVQIGYEGSKFHRIIPGFMAQGGDFTNHNGTGGKTIWGTSDKFDDENFKEKHLKGGMLSMANAGPNTNGSQFFLTFVATPWLDGKHVVFGKLIKAESIEGDKFVEMPTEDALQKLESTGSQSGKPTRPVTVVKSGVIVGPGPSNHDFKVDQLEGTVTFVP